MKNLFGSALLFVSMASFAQAANGIAQVQIFGNEVRVDVNVAGLFTAKVKVTFENAVGLHANAIAVEALAVDPLDPQLLARMPNPAIGIPGLFPVILEIGPSAQSGLTFTGVANVDISTELLPFDPSFRLFTAHGGGGFEDITNFSGVGSYRVRGTTGEFSEFLIVADGRVNSSVVHSKFSNLQADLDSHSQSIEAGVFDQLQGLLDSAFSKYQTGFTAAAIGDIESFEELVRENQGAAIPDLYRANDPQTRNVAGILRSGAATLAFSLKLM